MDMKIRRVKEEAEGREKMREMDDDDNGVLRKTAVEKDGIGSEFTPSTKSKWLAFPFS